MNKKEKKPVVETPPDPNKERRMDEVLRRLAGWIFSLSSEEQPFNKEDADRSIQDINYALHGTNKPPLEYRFITGKEANEESAKVFWRVNEKVVVKLLAAARLAESEMREHNCYIEDRNRLLCAINETEKHFGLKRD